MFLTQSGGLLGGIAKLLGYIIQVIFNGISAIGIANVGVAIILFTIVIKSFLLPLNIKQQKMMKINQIMQPEILKIQKKYRGKSDQQSMIKQNEEMQAVYKKYGSSPTGGCLPLLIQLPIIYALYRVVYNIPAYIPTIKNLYINIVEAIQGVSGYESKLMEVANTIGTPLKEGATTNQIIDFLANFKISTWETLSQAFSSNPDVVNIINTNSEKLINMNDFMFGINISEAPGFRLSIYLIIPFAAMIFQWLSMKINMSSTDDSNNPTMGMMKGMMNIMPVMSFFMCITLPSGVGIYWVVTSIYTIVQQYITNKYMERVDIDELIKKSQAKAAKKKKSWIQKMIDKQQQRLTGQSNSQDSEGTGIKNIATTSTKNIQNNSNNKNMGPIASKANMVLEYENKLKNKGGK